MSQTDYITISEFANRAGISRQAVYARTQRDLAPYCIEDGGKRYIHTDALAVVGVKTDRQVLTETVNPDCQVSEQELTEKCQPSPETVNPDCQPPSADIVTTLLKTIEQQNRIIEEQSKTIAENDRRIAEYAEKFAALAEAEQEISKRALATTEQAHFLHAADKNDALTGMSTQGCQGTEESVNPDCQPTVEVVNHDCQVSRWRRWCEELKKKKKKSRD